MFISFFIDVYYLYSVFLITFNLIFFSKILMGKIQLLSFSNSFIEFFYKTHYIMHMHIYMYMNYTAIKISLNISLTVSHKFGTCFQ